MTRGLKEANQEKDKSDAGRLKHGRPGNGVKAEDACSIRSNLPSRVRDVRERKPNRIGEKPLHQGQITNSFGRFLIPLLLTSGQFFGQIALPIAVELRPVAVFAENAGNRVPIEVEMGNRSPRADAGQQHGKQQNTG